MALERGKTRLRRLRQSGCAKAMLPRSHGAAPEVVFLNTSGGLTGGDKLRYSLTLEDGADAVAPTQTAERAYASPEGEAELTVEMSVGRSARLDWLPQETILFDRSAVRRRTRISLAPEARLLFCEMVVLGRGAMGETVETLEFKDRREIWRGDEPVMIEPVGIGNEVLARGNSNALLGGARAAATVALIAPNAEDALEPVRAALEGAKAMASAWDGKCVVRMLAEDAYPLRRLAARVIEMLGRRPLPRVWQN